VHTALAGYGTVDVLMDVRELLVELASPRDECLILDPALFTPAVAETIAANLTEFPRAVVAFSSVTTSALESSVILAQRTAARFVFRGTPNERSALERALVLTPDSTLGTALLAALDSNIKRLPSVLRDRLVSLVRAGDGPYSPDALAAATALARRSLDRYLTDAGLASAHKIIVAARVTSAYRAITTSRTPLGHIAAMLGYKSQRTMDAQLMALLDTTSSRLRAGPLPVTEAVNRLTQRLILRDTQRRRRPQQPQHISTTRVRTLKLVGGTACSRSARRTASGETITNP
jgi:AraC-like DNA-binding protein